VNLSSPFVKRPIGTALLTVGMALAGIGGFFALPVAPLPQVDYPAISVSAQLPGRARKRWRRAWRRPSSAGSAASPASTR
jgi:multidrug efflux pump subunit AcrB